MAFPLFCSLFLQLFSALLTLRNGKGPFRASALMLTVALPFVIALFFEFINSSSFFSYAAVASAASRGSENPRVL
ncbi:MAG TPA: hypothetical protein DCE55_13705 [Planctomycetaceae bacterium]|nr:hypothetical protein [Planctomycetaceae bacterium]